VPLKYYGPYQHSPIEPTPQVSEGSPLKRVILSVIVGVGKINLQTDLRATSVAIAVDFLLSSPDSSNISARAESTQRAEI